MRMHIAQNCLGLSDEGIEDKRLTDTIFSTINAPLAAKGRGAKPLGDVGWA